MRYILGLCVVLAVGNLAWTSEMSPIAGESEYQTPAATVTSTITQATGTAAIPATSPAGVYQAAAAQPATTTMSPAPTMISPGTYTMGTQPVASYATPMPNGTYTTSSYPMRMRGGLFRMRSPVYSYPATPVAATSAEPSPSYTVMPGQTYVQPVRRRFGLFQRWRQQATRVSGNAVYSTSGYPVAYYPTPVYTTYSYITPANYTTTYGSPTATLPASTMTPAGTTSPVYTPTTLSVPNGTPATSTAPAGTAAGEPPLQGATPAQATPSLPGVGQQGTTTPPLPAIPGRGPR